MKTFTNPYQSPQPTEVFAGEDFNPGYRVKIAIWFLAYLYPVWLAGSFYLTWLIAWVHLGHRPRPSLDDPKFIGGFMDIVYFVPGFFLMAIPVLAPLGLAASFFGPFRASRSKRFFPNTALAALYVGLCIIAILTLRADPGRVVEWWFD